jgi:transcription-repair coupling factor (superfamily II helicase)
MVKTLLEKGYRRVGRVSDPGEVALRGGILDIFPEGFDAPVRIELDHETVLSIRSIHPVTGEPFMDHEAVILLAAIALHPKTLRTSVKHLFFTEASALDPFVDIEPGDLVVHVVHGIGRYLGQKRVRTASGVEPLLALEYAGGDRLYVPLSELHLIQKYIGFEGRPPKLSRLGSRYWARSKEWARRGAASVAAELLEMEARRLSTPGFAFAKDTEWQKQLEAAFPYPQTPGQVRATAEVKADMERPYPMDRLLCGDVGYGKTEVALRAAFKAVMSGKQVAVLCPTTILAEQHYATFTQRMKPFPVEVAMLSRFQNPNRQREILNDLASGRVDVVIGTHRLLSKDVRFRDLGLLIIDEEQRFGVRHKEQLKRMRVQVDVLTMTATPIPRTLYLALMGAKSMSIIDTPPFARLPVVTKVTEEDPKLLQEGILKELERGGQVFVIYPWIEGIPRLYRQVTSLVPKARIVMAHGQMSSHLLERAMLAFLKQKADVLIATAIVESGIDIPNANTLFVFRADAFGLADLYQLRGRVGRFTRQAYAYFFIPKDLPMTAEAKKRLKALESFSHLGAGFQVALQDLQLRGAGNILGVEQHGHIMAVGFDLYCRLLRGEIERLKRTRTMGAETSSLQTVGG